MSIGFSDSQCPDYLVAAYALSELQTVQEVIMQLIVRGRGIRVSPALREHSVERVERALSPFTNHIASAELVFADLNGPRGGIAQSCRVSVALADGTRLIVQSRDTDFYAASGDAATRVGNLVGRELGRNRSRARRTRRPTHKLASHHPSFAEQTGLRELPR